MMADLCKNLIDNVEHILDRQGRPLLGCPTCDLRQNDPDDSIDSNRIPAAKSSQLLSRRLLKAFVMRRRTRDWLPREAEPKPAPHTSKQTGSARRLGYPPL